MNNFAALLLLSAVTCHAADEPVFETAHVYPSASAHAPTRGGFLRGNLYELHNATLVRLISTAYGVDPDRVIGGPSWLDSALFDVVATAPASTPPGSLRLMLRALLAGRFKLVLHDGTAPFPQHVLSAGSHPQLTKSTGSEESDCQSVTSANSQTVSLTCRSITFSEFAARLPRLAPDYLQGSPVFDRTNLPGAWDFTLKWTPRNRLAESGSEATPLVRALDRQLGLKLEIQPVPVPVLIVDRVQLPPAAQPGAPPDLPTFEVATIKPSAPTTTSRSLRLDTGALIDLRGYTLRELIKYAWNFEDNDVIDNDDLLAPTPKWASAQRFDILARTASGPRPDIETIRVMLRGLLADRFKLATHYETRPILVYELIAAKPKLTRADPAHRSDCRNGPFEILSSATPIFTVTCRSTTMAQLTENLQPFGALYIARPLIDATGLKGRWDFTLSWSPPHLIHISGATPGTPPDPNSSLTLIEALDRQLGLKLRLRKHTMPVLVVDHLEPRPIEN